MSIPVSIMSPEQTNVLLPDARIGPHGEFDQQIKPYCRTFPELMIQLREADTYFGNTAEHLTLDPSSIIISKLLCRSNFAQLNIVATTWEVNDDLAAVRYYMVPVIKAKGNLSADFSKLGIQSVIYIDIRWYPWRQIDTWSPRIKRLSNDIQTLKSLEKLC